MNSGKRFEQNWKNSVPSHIFFHRIKDSATSFSGGKFSKYTSSNPYDCFMFYDGFLFPMELKTSKEKRFSFQRSKSEKGKDIKLHQIDGLTQVRKFDRVISGFVFDCIEHGTYWMDIVDFNKFYNESNRKSIGLNEIISYNGVEVNRAMKKINYKYYIEDLLKTLIKGEKECGKVRENNEL
jgi:penicillin-binding protein-related factor A (putative recombinase)